MRPLSVLAVVLPAIHAGCATQEDTSGSLGDGTGSVSSAGSANGGSNAGGASAAMSGGASGSSNPATQAGSGGIAAGTAGSAGSMSVAGTSGSSATMGGAAGTSNGGTGTAGTGGSGTAGTNATAGSGTVMPDVTPPSTPGALQTSAITASSVTVSWNASTDNVGVTGYRLFTNNSEVTTVTGTIHTFKGLSAGTSYTFGVEAFDAADNNSARASKGAKTSAAPACDAGSAVATLSHAQSHSVSGNACIELSVNQAWNPVKILLEQTGGGTLTYSFKSCAGNGSGTIDSVLTMYEGNNPGCNFFVQLSGSGTVVYYD